MELLHFSISSLFSSVSSSLAKTGRAKTAAANIIKPSKLAAGPAEEKDAGEVSKEPADAAK